MSEVALCKKCFLGWQTWDIAGLREEECAFRAASYSTLTCSRLNPVINHSHSSAMRFSYLLLGDIINQMLVQGLSVRLGKNLNMGIRKCMSRHWKKKKNLYKELSTFGRCELYEIGIFLWVLSRKMRWSLLLWNLRKTFILFQIICICKHSPEFPGQ